MKKLFIFALLMVAAIGFGCRHRAAVQPGAGLPHAMTPPVPNTLRFATFRANTKKQVTSQTYVLDLKNVPGIYQKEIAFYIVNGLSHKGLTQAEQSECVISVSLGDSNVGLNSLNRVRSREVMLTIDAVENNEPCWNVSVIARARTANVEVNGWFAGMSAVACLYLGKQQNNDKPPVVIHTHGVGDMLAADFLMKNGVLGGNGGMQNIDRIPLALQQVFTKKE